MKNFFKYFIRSLYDISFYKEILKKDEGHFIFLLGICFLVSLPITFNIYSKFHKIKKIENSLASYEFPNNLHIENGILTGFPEKQFIFENTNQKLVGIIDTTNQESSIIEDLSQFKNEPETKLIARKEYYIFRSSKEKTPSVTNYGGATINIQGGLNFFINILGYILLVLILFGLPVLLQIVYISYAFIVAGISYIFTEFIKSINIDFEQRVRSITTGLTPIILISAILGINIFENFSFHFLIHCISGLIIFGFIANYLRKK